MKIMLLKVLTTGQLEFHDMSHTIGMNEQSKFMPNHCIRKGSDWYKPDWKEEKQIADMKE